MTDTAELIARANATIKDQSLIGWALLMRDMRDALAAQAQELNEDWPEWAAKKKAAEARAEAAEARLRELETTNAMKTIADVLAERDAIEAATIERCAAVVGDWRIAARIRALKATATRAIPMPNPVPLGVKPDRITLKLRLAARLIELALEAKGAGNHALMTFRLQRAAECVRIAAALDSGEGAA
jgi:hypothetical protein